MYECRYSASLRSLFTLLLFSSFFSIPTCTRIGMTRFLYLSSGEQPDNLQVSTYSRQGGRKAATTLCTPRTLSTAATAQCERKYHGRSSLQNLLFYVYTFDKTHYSAVVRTFAVRRYQWYSIVVKMHCVVVPISTIPDVQPLHEIP